MARGVLGTSDIHAAAAVTGPPITLSCWVYITTSGTQAFFGVGNSAGSNYQQLMVLSAFPMSLRGETWDGSTFPNATLSSAISQNTWHHVAFVVASATSRIVYVDGVASTENTASSTPSGINETVAMEQATPNAGLGALGGSGRIAEDAVWNAVLTATEIGLLARGEHVKKIRPSGSRGYWPLIGSESPEPDLSALQNFGVVTGSKLVPHPEKLKSFFGRRRRIVQVQVTVGRNPMLGASMIGILGG